MPSDFINIFSEILGWISTIVWTVSFYPQLILNFKLKSTRGLSLDFAILNFIGFTAYSLFNIYFFYYVNSSDYTTAPSSDYTTAPSSDYTTAPLVHSSDYTTAPLVHSSDYTTAPLVHSSDVLFAVHGFFLCGICIAQIYSYSSSTHNSYNTASPSFATLTLALILLGQILAISITSLLGLHSQTALIAYSTSYLKMIITLIKYIPQLLENRRNKSTKGFAIINILLDFAGGISSILQMLVDCKIQESWSPISLNPVKFGLGFTSLLFDIGFFIQHYIIYVDYQLIPGDIEEVVVGDDGDESSVKLESNASELDLGRETDALITPNRSRHSSYSSII